MKTNNKKNFFKRNNRNTNKNSNSKLPAYKTHYILSTSGNLNDDLIALPIGLLKQYIPLSILTDRLNRINENRA